MFVTRSINNNVLIKRSLKCSKEFSSFFARFWCKLKVKRVHNKRCSPASFGVSSIGLPRNVSSISSEPVNFTGIQSATNLFTNRTHTCGELKDTDVGQLVQLSGWIEFQRSGKFITLRDAYGITQLMVPDECADIKAQFEDTTLESVITVTGKVCRRPTGMENKKMSTGNIEVVLSQMKVLNYAKKILPFAIRDFNKAKEALRLKYRYLDLRFPVMQHNLRLRSSVLMKMRDYLCNHCNFVDVETPTLFRRTPGGAQEFVVPTRMPGQFYSLVQSPQQFKQMLMVGGIDRYFQVARCYRDEGARPDRQPEFTQLDIELSFTDRDGVLELVEGLLNHSWPKDVASIPQSFPRMTYQRAMEEYGSDKPDTRCPIKIQNFTDELKSDSLLQLVAIASTDDFTARILVVPKGSVHLTNSIKAKYEQLAKDRYPLARLFMGKVSSDSSFDKKFSRMLSSSGVAALKSKLDLGPSDCLFVAVGDEDQVLPLLGSIRVDYIDYLETKGVSHRDPGFNFLWVVDFPLFLPGEDSGVIESAHHPFTAPFSEDVALLKNSPLKVRGLHYDLVLNGSEVGGGSIRIHDPQLQLNILDNVLGIDARTLKHLVEALDSGAPPHGGIALGIDRLISMICGARSIRDVIAFPKGVDGKDQMSGAPVPISVEEKKLYHIQTVDHNPVGQTSDSQCDVGLLEIAAAVTPRSVNI